MFIKQMTFIMCIFCIIQLQFRWINDAFGIRIVNAQNIALKSLNWIECYNDITSIKLSSETDIIESLS